MLCAVYSLSASKNVCCYGADIITFNAIYRFVGLCSSYLFGISIALWEMIFDFIVIMARRCTILGT